MEEAEVRKIRFYREKYSGTSHEKGDRYYDAETRVQNF
jgi:hypothetical protein